MGNPLYYNGDGTSANCDKGDPDSLIDIYLVDPSRDYLPRAGVRLGYDATTDGAWPSVERTDLSNACSGYVVLMKSHVSTDDALQSVLSHELYHLLQRRYNCFTRTWFRKASALWAQVHYFPSNTVVQDFAKRKFALWLQYQPFRIDNYCNCAKTSTAARMAITTASSGRC
jgi:hypothetical protein